MTRETKKCNKCGDTYLLKFMTKHRGGYTSICKSCNNRRIYTWRNRNIERHREMDKVRQRKYRKDPVKGEKIRMYDRSRNKRRWIQKKIKQAKILQTKK